MSAEYFLDTNILVYAFDKSAPKKRAIALSIIQPNTKWAISWQVIQEFASVGLHKFKVPLDLGFLEDFLEQLLWPHCQIFPSHSLYKRAFQLRSETQYRFYDCLIVAAALESGAETLYSEDLQHGRNFGHLRIVNPFLE